MEHLMGCSHHIGALDGHRRCMRWKPMEIAAIVLGFVVFWPVGLALLGWKIFNGKIRHDGDFGQFARERWGEFERRSGLGSMSRDFAGGWRTSGNSAFDDWRKAELERLEEERRKIHEAEQAFYDYLEGLRRAKDREEFERFMASRAARASQNGAPGGAA
jgi:Protein of unknown function (DUF2852)